MFSLLRFTYETTSSSNYFFLTVFNFIVFYHCFSFFGAAFRQAGEKTKSRVRHDFFDPTGSFLSMRGGDGGI